MKGNWSASFLFWKYKCSGSKTVLVMFFDESESAVCNCKEKLCFEGQKHYLENEFKSVVSEMKVAIKNNLKRTTNKDF